MWYLMLYRRWQAAVEDLQYAASLERLQFGEGGVSAVLLNNLGVWVPCMHMCNGHGACMHLSSAHAYLHACMSMDAMAR